MNWHPIAQAAIETLSPIILALIAALFTLLVKRLSQSNMNTKTVNVLNRLSGVTQLVVSEVAQTTIEAARKTAGDGNALPKDVADAARDAALARIKSFTSKEDLALIAKVFGLDTEEKLAAFFNTHVEAAVNQSKPE